MPLFALMLFVWNSSGFLNLDVCFLLRLEKLSAIISSNHSAPFFLSSPSGTPYNVNIILLDIVP